MGKFLLGVLTGFALVFLAVVLVLVAAVRMRNKPPGIADNSVLVLRLEGEVPEKPGVELPILDNGRGAVTVTGLWVALRQAAADRRIKRLVLQPEGLQAGWGRSRRSAPTLQLSASPVSRSMPTCATPVAANTTSPWPPTASISSGRPAHAQGDRAEILYFKNTLDKLGVTIEVEHAGKYNETSVICSPVSGMSPETREVTSSVVDDLFANLVNRIAEARHKTPDQVRASIDNGPFTATQARQAGLVDSLAFEDQMWSELKDKLHAGEPTKVPIEKYIKVPAEDAGLRAGSRIALVAGEGDIVRGDPDDEGTDGELGSYGFEKAAAGSPAPILHQGVIVRIDVARRRSDRRPMKVLAEMKLLSQKKLARDFHVRRGRFRRLLHGPDRRRPSVAYFRTEKPEDPVGDCRQARSARPLRQAGVSKDAVETREQRRHRFRLHRAHSRSARPAESRHR